LPGSDVNAFLIFLISRFVGVGVGVIKLIWINR